MCTVDDWACPGSPLLATASRDQKVKLWDVAAACARENTVAACVGSIKLATSASALLPHEGGSSCSVVVIVMEKEVALLDLRTMRLEQTIAACTRGGLTCSAAVSGGLRSHLFCTGTRHGVASVWDCRKGSSCMPEASAGPGGAPQASTGVTPVVSMNAFTDSSINHIHIDSHKVITTTSFPRGDECPIKAWCAVTGELQAELEGSVRTYTAAEDAREIEALMNQWGGMLPRDPMREGVTSLAVHGPLLVTGNFKGQLVARDYRDCIKERFDPSRGTLEGSSRLMHGRSKFWATDDNEEDVDTLGSV